MVALWSWKDSIVGKALALHAANPGSIPGIHYGPWSPTMSDP